MDDYPAADSIPEPSASIFHGELVDFLTNNQAMRKTARSALKQSLWAGGGALGGAFLMGPVGGLMGGIIGSVVGFLKSDEYDGALLAVMTLDGTQREALIGEVAQVLTVAGATASMQSTEAFHKLLKYAYHTII